MSPFLLYFFIDSLTILSVIGIAGPSSGYYCPVNWHPMFVGLDRLLFCHRWYPLQWAKFSWLFAIFLQHCLKRLLRWTCSRWKYERSFVRHFYLVSKSEVMAVHILARKSMRVIALFYGFKEGTLAFPRGTNNLGKRQNHLATPVCSSFLNVSNQNNFSGILKRQMRATIARKI